MGFSVLKGLKIYSYGTDNEVRIRDLCKSEKAPSFYTATTTALSLVIKPI